MNTAARPRRRIALLGIAVALVATALTTVSATRSTSRAGAADLSMTLAYSASMHGDVLWLGNTNLTCKTAFDGGSNVCASMRNGTDNTNVNDNFQMSYSDGDGVAGTVNSSAANLTIPVGATVVSAWLYWSGTESPWHRTSEGQAFVTMTAAAIANRNKVKFKTPVDVTYPARALNDDLVAANNDPLAGFCGDNTDTTSETLYYQCAKDVTTKVQLGLSGTYWVGDIGTGQGGNAAAGWALAVVIQDTTLALNKVNLYRGSRTVAATGTGVTDTISGFKTGPAPRKAKIGFFVLEGDRNIAGDFLQIDGGKIANTANPLTNTMNGTVSIGVAPTTFVPGDQSAPFAAAATNPFTANPALAVDNMGIDIDVMGAWIPAGATSTSFKFGTTGDQYFISGISIVFPLPSAFPDVTITKTIDYVDDITTAPGSMVRFSLPVQNWGDDSASNVVITDALQAGFTYVPNSIEIFPTGVTPPSPAPLNSNPLYAKTDATADDTADFGSNIVTARVGTGANATQGGNVPQCVAVLPCGLPITTGTVTFRAVVVPTTPLATALTNVAHVDFVADTSGLPGGANTKSWGGAATIGYPNLSGCIFADTLPSAAPDGLWSSPAESGLGGIRVSVIGGLAKPTDVAGWDSAITNAAGCFQFLRVKPDGTVGTFSLKFDRRDYGGRVPTVSNISLSGPNEATDSDVPENGDTISAIPQSTGIANTGLNLGLRSRRIVKVCLAETPLSVTPCVTDWMWQTP